MSSREEESLLKPIVNASYPATLTATRKRPFNGALLTLNVEYSFEKRKGKVAREISPQWGYRAFVESSKETLKRFQV